MVIHVRLFAGLRQRAGRGVLELDLPEGARVADALAAVEDVCAGTRVVMAVNRVYAPPETVLAAGDELALIPPVSGGSGPPVPRDAGEQGAGEAGAGGAAAGGAAAGGRDAEGRGPVIDGPLSLDALAARVRDPRAGAVVTFAGVTREVAALDYEAYAEMAGPVIEEIVAAAIARHGLCAAAAEHRVGEVALGEASVIVAASAPHRGEAFAGAREIIDEIKSRAPIWKREEGEWVEGTVPETSV